MGRSCGSSTPVLPHRPPPPPAAFMNALHAPYFSAAAAPPPSDAATGSAATVVSSRAGFPPMGIVAIVGGCLFIVLGCLSYRFRRLFPLWRDMHRRTGSAASSHEPAGDRLSPRSRYSPFSESNPLAPGDAGDIVLYTRMPRAAQGGGHHWVPCFSRMYNRASPYESRGALLAPHSPAPAAAPAAAVATASGRPGSDAADRERVPAGEGLGHASSTEGADVFLRAVSEATGNRTPRSADDASVDASVFVPSALDASGPTRNSTSNAARHNGELQIAVSTDEAAPSAEHRHGVTPQENGAAWMTAGVPLRFFSTFFFSHAGRGSVTAPAPTAHHRSSTLSPLLPGRAPAQPHRRESHDPFWEPADGTVSYANVFITPPHAFLPLAQFCDLSAWHLVERPELPLGEVRVYSDAHLAHDAGLQYGKAAAAAGVCEEAEDMPSVLLYGASAYLPSDATRVPTAAPPAQPRSVPDTHSDAASVESCSNHGEAWQ